MTATTLRLDANEGRPCLGDEAIASLAGPESLRRYPDARPLEAAIAARSGLSPERVLATAGADDAIDRAIRSFGGAAATVLSTQPAFEEYAAAAARSYSRYACAKHEPDGPFPLDSLVAAIAAERPSLVVIASPDNPGGGTVSTNELAALAEAAAGVGAAILFDAAYSDFDEGNDVYGAALDMPEVISTRTFSKAYGLAGLRAGWAAGSAENVARLRAAGPPFSLCSFSVAAALAALELGGAARDAFVARVGRERAILAEALAAAGARAWPSRANFVAAYVPDAAGFSEALSARGVKIRTWIGAPGREGMIRITCPGDERDFGRLMEALGDIGRRR
jgi:histidinol-phosphate aminotransferase